MPEANMKATDEFVYLVMRGWLGILTETFEKMEKLNRMGWGQSQQNGMIHPKYGIEQTERAMTKLTY